ncbi:hypothetical protein ABC977_16450 [Thioalkalicoccus limnaeus]|uniref:Uncharacterized protein n=1 Tax=Thioalkalicoccus limnaeus TaxID=120681 RepID=A0ABV4BHH8_9GAMM
MLYLHAAVPVQRLSERLPLGKAPPDQGAQRLRARNTAQTGARAKMQRKRHWITMAV